MNRDAPTDSERIPETVSPEVFDLVTATYLSENRSRLEASHVVFYRVVAHEAGRYRVAPADWSLVSRLLAGPHAPQEFALPRQWTAERAPEPSREDSFQIRWNALVEMSAGERVQELAKTRHQFEAEVAQASTAEKTALILGITETTFLINRASMSTAQAVAPLEAAALVHETNEIIRAVVELVAESELAVTLFQTLKNLSSGHTLDHIVRVFSLMVGFLHYYNTLHSRGMNQKLRAAFGEGYREDYRRLLPHLHESQLTFDNLVRLPALPVGKVQIYSLGALMHDVGKIMDLSYFEGDLNYDATRIKQHPIVGSALFLKAYGNKHEEARAIVGNHHHYLGHRDGYSVLRWEGARGGKTPALPQCSVADQLEHFLHGQALSFLPVEMCAVADVYDALTDPSRKYRTKMTAATAVAFMRENFRAPHKLDPIVFDLFVSYLIHSGEDIPPLPSRTPFAL